MICLEFGIYDLEFFLEGVSQSQLQLTGGTCGREDGGCISNRDAGEVVEDDHASPGSPVLRVREVGSIEKIENLQPKLQSVLLRYGDGPRQADIERGETWSDHGIATQRPQASSGL